MTLEEYAKTHELSALDLSSLLGVSPEAARLYLKGKRIPRPPVMRAIIEITKGSVTADSFYREDAPVEDEAGDAAA